MALFMAPKALYRNRYSLIPHSHRWWYSNCQPFGYWTTHSTSWAIITPWGNICPDHQEKLGLQMCKLHWVDILTALKSEKGHICLSIAKVVWELFISLNQTLENLKGDTTGTTPDFHAWKYKCGVKCNTFRALTPVKMNLGTASRTGANQRQASTGSHWISP